MDVTYVGQIALWILAFLIPLQLYIGARMAGKSSQSSAHYFISGKELPLILVFFDDFATVMGVGNFIGYAGKGYSIGLNQLWMLLGEQGSKVLFAVFLAGYIGRYAYNTINEFMEAELWHDKWLRAFGGVVMVIPMICWTGAQAIGIGSLLSVVMGIDPTTGILVASMTAILYTTIGGMWAIAWTDLIQGIIRVFVGFIFFAIVLIGVDGIGGIKASVLATKPDLWSVGSLGFNSALALFLAPVCGQFTYQAWWQRCFAAKNASVARRAFLYTSAFAVVMCTASILVGMAAYVLNPNLARPDMAFPWLLSNWLHPVVAALLVVTIIGADMTVSAGLLNAGVTLLLMDVVRPLAKPDATEKELIKYARLMTFFVGVGSLWVAFHFPTVLSAALFGYTATGGGLFVPLILGLLWKDSEGHTCVSKNAAFSALLLGGGTAAYIQYDPALLQMFGGGIVPGLCVSLVLTVGVSLFERGTRRPSIPR